MLEQILNRLRQQPKSGPVTDRRLAAAVLLLEVARADFEHHPLELEAVRRALARDFGLPEGELEQLLAGAQRESAAAVSLHEYVQALNRAMQPEDKRALMQSLWRVAYADGKIDALEEHTLRRLADLLHVPHHDFIKSKLGASDS